MNARRQCPAGQADIIGGFRFLCLIKMVLSDPNNSHRKGAEDPQRKAKHKKGK
jgi:hypothetical protein